MNAKPVWPFKYMTERNTDVDPRRRFLAEGDSWFSIGSLKMTRRPNLLTALEFDREALVVSCASPGDTISAMADRRRQDPYFDALLAGSRSDWFPAILISGGGNDMIGMAQIPPTDRSGAPGRLEDRLLLTPQEAGTGKKPSRYVSALGWETLTKTMHNSLQKIAALRSRGLSASSPLLAHTYHLPTARPAGVPGAAQGWLHRAYSVHGIPEEDHQPLTEHLFSALRILLLSFDADSTDTRKADRRIDGFHVFDSAAVNTVVAAAPGTVGESGDWINEIHLTSEGYSKLGKEMGPWVEEMLRRYA